MTVLSSASEPAADAITHGVDSAALRISSETAWRVGCEIMILDEDQQVRWMNDAKRRRLGTERAAAALGRRCSEVPGLCVTSCDSCPAPQSSDAAPAPHWATADHGGAPVFVERAPIRLPDGRVMTCVRHQFLPLQGDRSGTLSDLSSRQSIWTAMAAVTTGLAHELRNPLCALQMRLDAIRNRPGYGLNDSGRRAMEEVVETTHRLAGVIETLCAFNPGDAGTTGRVRPGNEIEQALAGLGARLDGIDVEVIDQCTGTVRFEPGELRALVTRLAANACEAMESRGALTITLTGEQGRCLIDVADTGRGIPAEIMDRLGQPFVTTKPAGQGSGLGLSLCLLALDRRGGELRVLRSGADGTTIRVSLPDLEPTGSGER